MTPDELCLSSPDVGPILVRDGAEILLDPLEDAEDATLRLFVLGPGLGALMDQRGSLVLHGSALSIRGRAVALLGPSRAGKSTTAAGLAGRGHDVLTDDLVVVGDESPPVVLPGFPALELTERTKRALGLPWQPISSDGSVGKRYYRTAPSLDTRPRPMHTVYVVTKGDEQTVDRLAGSEALVALVGHSYAAGVLEETDALSSNFDRCARLADVVRVRRLERTDDLERVGDLAALIERDCLASES